MLHPDATTIRLIHQHMIQEEMSRHHRPDRDNLEPQQPRSRRTRALRRIAADALRAAARWIEPRRHTEGPLQPTKPAH